MTLPPNAIDLRACAQKAETLTGQAPLAAFERLAQGLPGLDPAPAPVNWSAQAEWRQPLGEHAESGAAAALEPQLWLHLQASAEVPQTCQRCLSAYGQDVAVDRWFRFVASEAAALEQDDGCEEDLLVLEPRFDLAALLEDELLLELPLIAMHDICPQPPQMSAGELVEEPEAQRPHAFAALAALKGGRKS